MCDNYWVLVFFVVLIIIVGVYNFLSNTSWWKSIINDYNKNGTDLTAITKSLIKACVLIIIVGGILLFFVFFTFKFDDLIKFNEHTGQIGDTIGGVLNPFIALAAVIVTGLAFYMQYQANKQVQDQFEKQELNEEREKIEGRFFQLLTLHRANVDEIVFRNGRTNEVLISGRKVFKEIYEQVLEAEEIAKLIFKHISVQEFLLPSILVVIKEDGNREKYAIRNLAYYIVFFGVSKKDEVVKVHLEKVFKVEKVKQLYEFYRLFPANYEKKHMSFLENVSTLNEFKFLELFTKIPEDIESTSYLKNESWLMYFINNKKNNYKRFGGHQHKLGHYFRHLFQIVTYIDKQKVLSYIEKYEYIKTLRAQLSNYEQYVFYFNSMTHLGYEWEKKYTVEVKIDYNKCLISKYNLIKNIPNPDLHDIKTNYPLIDFEFLGKSKDRPEIQKKYWDTSK